MLNAQQIMVTNIQKLELGHETYFPKFGNSSQMLLLSGEQYKGLSIYNLNTKTEEVISQEPGAGNKPQMNADGSILFREVSFVNGRKNIEYKVYNQGAIKNTKATFPGLQVKADGQKIKIYLNETEISSLQPNEQAYYLWPSLSPDKTKILYTAAGKGTFVMDRNGKILAELGYLNAPKWLNDNWVIGMNDKDNGDQIITSTIEAVNLETGNRTVLTKTDELKIALYPEPSPLGDRVVFNGSKGQVYILDLLIKN